MEKNGTYITLDFLTAPITMRILCRNKAINNKNHFKWFRFLWIWFLSTPFIMTLVSCHSSSLVHRTAFFCSGNKSNAIQFRRDFIWLYTFFPVHLLWNVAQRVCICGLCWYIPWESERVQREKTDRTSPYGIRSFSIWSTLCGSPVLCRVVCALWKIIIIRNNFLCSFDHSFATTPGWLFELFLISIICFL